MEELLRRGKIQRYKNNGEGCSTRVKKEVGEECGTEVER